MILMYINGASGICNFASKANVWRDTNEIINKYITDSFIINHNFFIFLQIDTVMLMPALCSTYIGC